MYQPSCLLPCCQGKPGELAKKLLSKPQKRFILSLRIPIKLVYVDDPHLGVGGAARQPEEAAARLVGQVGPAPPRLVLALREAGAVPHKRLSCGRKVFHGSFALVTPFVKAHKLTGM